MSDITLKVEMTGLDEIKELARQISAKKREIDALIRKMESTEISMEVKRHTADHQGLTVADKKEIADEVMKDLAASLEKVTARPKTIYE